MVKIEQIRTANFESFDKIENLTAVFVAGTNGIGEYTLCRLANLRNRQEKATHVYLVGRNEVKANSVIDKCKIACPQMTFDFIKTQDIALLTEVESACKEISKLERARSQGKGTPSIDLLVMTQGKIQFGEKIGEQCNECKETHSSPY